MKYARRAPGMILFEIQQASRTLPRECTGGAPPLHHVFTATPTASHLTYSPHDPPLHDPTPRLAGLCRARRGHFVVEPVPERGGDSLPSIDRT